MWVIETKDTIYLSLIFKQVFLTLLEDSNKKSYGVPGTEMEPQDQRRPEPPPHPCEYRVGFLWVSSLAQHPLFLELESVRVNQCVGGMGVGSGWAMGESGSDTGNSGVCPISERTAVYR